MNYIQLNEQLKEFLIEDIGRGDQSAAIFPASERASGTFLLKESGIICGLWLAPMIYELLGGNVQFTSFVEEGTFLEANTPIATVYGPIQTLLTGERLILNLWQRLGGIATATHLAIKQLNDQTIRVTDTRKTIPGLRQLDKYAVTQGGGFNHRKGLDDAIMLKDNHIAFFGSITKAVQTAREQNGHMIKIEVEVETIEAFKEAVAAKVDVIMIDNQSPKKISQFLVHNHQKIITEASGNITLQNIHEYQGCGVDYLSLGFLTHSVSALDISFNSKNGNDKVTIC
ncbi:carboxylating nicotinate-nucleotide diphosphorylase [Enterococcus villorum]|uniref:nicotinate-nucleotide diphosphorylase (carboxylating) n=2 Tax=Enterococcus villorum TaxID=112904 RepID=A0ABP2URH7_9ENTE|nr:carboxylating nicotinate-nucleotide diphosphorylase [Enterococcus villorum]EOH89701.1 nicotinate-nucleotide diphosphorylase (carboxylating) [Enterococcus villorum ATCC 700913]EOW78372.1 nicotinate-nucleotide diphosphorylase (carboxylating) [Enterococcus villorum ATCC 700913]GEL92342.1 nicotinate-nucleotide diphosphorylase (carboxylating) [Enterococcus villorum]